MQAAIVERIDTDTLIDQHSWFCGSQTCLTDAHKQENPEILKMQIENINRIVNTSVVTLSIAVSCNTIGNFIVNGMVLINICQMYVESADPYSRHLNVYVLPNVASCGFIILCLEVGLSEVYLRNLHRDLHMTAPPMVWPQNHE